jgi:hypothetical protein
MKQQPVNILTEFASELFCFVPDEATAQIRNLRERHLMRLRIIESMDRALDRAFQLHAWELGQEAE